MPVLSTKPGSVEGMAELPAAHSESYCRNFKSSAVLGGARIINMLVGILRVKAFALLLGTKGIGIYGTYDSIVAMLMPIASFGIAGSGIREVAQAAAAGDAERLGRCVKTIRRAVLVFGIFGAVVTLALAWPLSRMTFQNSEHAVPIALLSLAVVASMGASTRAAVIQGLGRMGDLARQNILGATVGTALSCLIILLLKERGISLAVCAVYGAAFASAWLFGRKIAIPPVRMSWKESAMEARHLIKLGLALMNAIVLSVTVFYLCRVLIARQLGMATVGLYSCAFSLSGKFVNLVIEPMWSDFFPRASAVAHDARALNRVVNEQIEIALLLAAPGLLATLVFAPVLVRLLYSEAFDLAATLVRFFTFGCLLSAICGPVRMVLLSTGQSLLDFGKEVWSALFHLAAVAALLKLYGLAGAALAYALHGAMDLAVTYALAGRVSQFRWSRPVLRLGGILLAVQLTALLAGLFLPRGTMLLGGGVATVVVSLLCLREALRRLGPGHRFSRMISRLPLLGRLTPASAL